MLSLSLIIPAYNAQKTILPLLDSIARSKNVNRNEIEVIVVDDLSRDGTVGKLLDNKSYNFYKSYKIIQLKKNSGPAHARNVGAKYAKGKVLVFLDADVFVYTKTLSEIERSFRDDPDLLALTGVWDKKQKNRKFFPKFKALRDWSYWINERDPKNYYYLFSTRIAAIERHLFERLGGFDETYKAALVEDIELTYRIARRHAVVFNPKVVVHHEFEDFFPIAKKYFWRAYFWSKMYRARKKFDPVATTGKEAITTISAGGLVGSLILWGGGRVLLIQFGIGGEFLSRIDILFTTFCFLFFVVHLLGVRKFLLFCLKEEGIVFTLKAFVTGIALYLAILSGSLLSFFTR